MIYSSLEGVLGEVYAECANGIPVSAVCVVADFAFFAGKPSSNLLTYDFGKPFLILTPRDTMWQSCMERTLAPNEDTVQLDNVIEGPYGKVQKACRYAFRKDTAFDCTHLALLKDRVPGGYTLHPIREQAYRECLETPWSRDLVANYASYEDYHTHARGYVIRETTRGAIVAGASAYTYYSGGIEIEVDTCGSPTKGFGDRMRRDTDPRLSRIWAVSKLGRRQSGLRASCTEARVYAGAFVPGILSYKIKTNDLPSRFRENRSCFLCGSTVCGRRLRRFFGFVRRHAVFGWHF